MKDGVVQQAASPLEVYNKPANTFVAGFIGSPAMNFLELSLAGSKLADPHNGLAITIPDRLRGALKGYGKAQGRPRRSRPKRCAPLRAMPTRPAPRSSQSTSRNTSDMKPCSTPRADRIGWSPESAPQTIRSIGEKRPFLFDPDQMHLFDLGDRRKSCGGLKAECVAAPARWKPASRLSDRLPAVDRFRPLSCWPCPSPPASAAPPLFRSPLRFN